MAYIPPTRRDGVNPYASAFVPHPSAGGAPQQQQQYQPQQAYAPPQQQQAYQPQQQAGFGGASPYLTQAAPQHHQAYAPPQQQQYAPAAAAAPSAFSHATAYGHPQQQMQHHDPMAALRSAPQATAQAPGAAYVPPHGHHQSHGGGAGFSAPHGGGGAGFSMGGGRGGYGGGGGGFGGGYGGGGGGAGGGFSHFFSQGARPAGFFNDFVPSPIVMGDRSGGAAGASAGPAAAAAGGAPGTGGGHQHVREDRPDEQLFEEQSRGINFDLYENIQVTVKPNTVTPAETFASMGLHPLLQENVARCRYEKPTPVQKNGIPIVVEGHDLMACAQTGSGKTAAYLLPAINHCLMKTGAAPPSRQATPVALIMAPTRELCVQIYDEGRKFTFRTGMRCVVVYGGADQRQQIHELQRGCSILVATPGRLWEMFQRGIISFRSIQFLVLDEADRMLDMGFEPQIRAIVSGPQTDMPRTGERQTLMYSATFPRDIQTLAREFLHQHFFLQVGRVGSTTENITQDIQWVEDFSKKEALFQLTQQHPDQLILVFVEKKRDADYIERFLHSCHIPATSIHGDRVQREREEALAMFRSGMCRVLVATDVASRGLDIPNVNLVVQYDLPTNIDDYVHRIGRTGRAGKTGVAVCFFNEKNRNLADDMIEILTEAKQVVPDFVQAMATPKRPQHQQFRGGGGGFRGGRGGRGGRGFGGGGGFRGAGAGGGFRGASW